MVDTQLFWYKIKLWCAKMADRASDYVYTDESKENVNIVNLLLLGWILLGLVVYIVGNVIATQLKKRKAKDFARPISAGPEEQQPCKEEPVVAAKAPISPEGGLFSKVDDFNQTLPLKPLHAPVCTGDDSDLVDWINSVFSWIYNQRVVSPVLDSWLSSLNARTRLASVEHGVLVDFQSVVHSNEPPVITEAFESIQSSNEVNVACDVEVSKLAFEILVTQVKEKDRNTYNFILNLNRLAGQLNTECNPKKLTAVSRFSETPQVQLDIQQKSENSLLPEDYEPLHDLICEIASEAFASSIVNHNFSMYPECPRYKKSSETRELDVEELVQKDQKERLLVKIVKASNLGTSQSSTKPYCVIEMDEPQQRFETTPVDDAASPFWDESFIFALKHTSAELLFEIYDKNLPVNENFLGLCIVSVEELVKNPSQRQIIPLQSRPLEKDNVSGTLTAEFLFMDRDIPTPEVTQLGQMQAKSDAASKVIETNSRVTAGGTIITTTTIKRTTEGNTGNASDLSENLRKFQNGTALGLSHSRQNFLKQMIADNTHNASDVECINFEDNNPAKLAERNDDELSNEKATDALIETKFNEQNCMNGVWHDEITKIDETVLLNGHLLSKPNGVVNVEFPDEKIVNDVSKELHGKESVAKACNADEAANDVSNLESMSVKPISDSQDNGLCSSSSTIVDPIQNDNEEITETALKELEKPGKTGSTNKSMLIIHSVQRAENSGLESLEASPIAHTSLESQSSYSESLPASPSRLRNGVDRSRPKVKKSLIGNLRKKLSFRKPRSRSMEAQERLNASPVPGSDGNNRSVSSDRMKGSSGPRDTSSLRSGRKHLAFPGSSRSSFSEASGLSTASSRTYINENSTLVIEINENGIIKRYLIPTSMIHRSKWKKKGTKLHLYNDHVFIAKHLSGMTLCHVCKKYLTRRPGKQGYQCRDCNLQCHKSCHVKVPEYCPNSSVTAMEVEYVHDPRLTKPKSA